MYNSSTEYKIKDIPLIEGIDVDRLPQELTKIYAQIVSLRRKVSDGTINFDSAMLKDGFSLLQKLSNNLELLLLTVNDVNQKESIAFVAATANSLIYKMSLDENKGEVNYLGYNKVSRYVSAIVLFLIGNSQADAAELAASLSNGKDLSLTETKLIKAIKALATGDLYNIMDLDFDEVDISNDYPLMNMATDYLWRELGLGIKNIARSLLGHRRRRGEYFQTVIDLSLSSIEVEGIGITTSAFAGPYRLAKLLKLMEHDITGRSIINIPTPVGVDDGLWTAFLSKLAGQRPYLWENHKQAVETDFLTPGTSAVLTLPTGAGKSTLSELKIASCLYSGRIAIYIVPTHALEDQVNRNLGQLFEGYYPEEIEIDSEFTIMELENLDSSPVLVMTPERCLTLLNLAPSFFNRVGLVVFDEFHLIHGTDIVKDRRSVDAMYCLLSLFSIIPQADFLLISAMVENGAEICDWIAEITKRQCLLFNSSWKPTRQLHGCLVYEESDILKLQENVRKNKRVNISKGRIEKSLGLPPYCFFSLKNIWETDEGNDYFKSVLFDSNVNLKLNNFWQLKSNRNEVAAKMAVHFLNLGLKTLIFVDNPVVAVSTRKNILKDWNSSATSFVDFCKENESDLNELGSELGDLNHSYFDNDSICVHHGLLLPMERKLIEQYYKRSDGAMGLIATATLAQGINLPAEIVIIAGDDRFDESTGGRETVQPHELLNAAGRAGRAGLSSQGAVILIPGDIVTIKESTVSERWWTLKESVFSKGDQCLTIEDPLEYLLDTFHEDSDAIDKSQANILYRFKAEKLSEFDTRILFKNSFYAFKSKKNDAMEHFEGQLENLLARRRELDDLSEDVPWAKEVSFQTGVDPSLIIELSGAISDEDFEVFINLSIEQYIDWFFRWIMSDEDYLDKIFTRQSTISQIKKACGLKADKHYSSAQILSEIKAVRDTLKLYVRGHSLHEINLAIPGTASAKNHQYLANSRNFVLRLVPELSFSFGILSFVTLEMAKQRGIDWQDISINLKLLASCIREGFDDADKLFFKRRYKFKSRVNTHALYDFI